MEDQVALIAAFRSSALLGLVFFHLPLEKKAHFVVWVLWFEFCWHRNSMVIEPVFGTFAFTLDFKQHGFCASPLRPDSGTLISK